MPKPQLTTALLDRILSFLHREHSSDLETLCTLMGLLCTPGRRYSKAAYKQYVLIGRGLQRLKKDGMVKFVGGRGAGWRLV